MLKARLAVIEYEMGEGYMQGSFARSEEAAKDVRALSKSILDLAKSAEWS